MTTYIALLHKDPDSSFGVTFPDFPGCVTGGETLDAARMRAIEALAFHMEGLREDGEPIPAPSNLDAVMADANNREAAAAFLVDAPMVRERAARYNLTMLPSLMAGIDHSAMTKGETRSRWLAEAAREKILRDRGNEDKVSAFRPPSVAAKFHGRATKDGRARKKAARKPA